MMKLINVLLKNNKNKYMYIVYKILKTRKKYEYKKYNI